jgi:hypothetical protein
MAEGRVTHVVDQSQGLDQILIQPQLGGDGAGDLRDFNGMSQAIAEMIGVAAGENLGFVLQAAKSAGMHHAVAIPLEIVTIRMPRLSIPPSAAVRGAKSVGS